LLQAGIALLEGHRSEDLGLREVARAVGVSPSAVYRHFPDKGALLRAIAFRGFDMMGQMQMEAAAAAAPRAAFAASGVAYVRFALRHPAIFRLMFSSAPPRDLFSEDASQQFSSMRNLRDHVADLSASPLPPEAQKIIAIRAWSLVHGLAVLALDRIIVVDDAMIEAVVASAAP
jgi:AcrR family transcriptional regulator